jgi:hypothetical protein
VDHAGNLEQIRHREVPVRRQRRRPSWILGEIGDKVAIQQADKDRNRLRYASDCGLDPGLEVHRSAETVLMQDGTIG